MASHGMAYYWEELCCGSASLTHSLTHLVVKRYTWNEKKRSLLLNFSSESEIMHRNALMQCNFCTYMHASERERKRASEGVRVVVCFIVSEWKLMVVISYEVMQKASEKTHRGENKKKIERIDRVRLLNGWILLHKKMQLERNIKSKKEKMI